MTRLSGAQFAKNPLDFTNCFSLSLPLSLSSSPFINVIFKMMMKVGANLGTTTTGIIAALAASGHQLALALQLALCHCIFNVRFSTFSMCRFSAQITSIFFLFWVPHKIICSWIYFKNNLCMFLVDKSICSGIILFYALPFMRWPLLVAKIFGQKV